jgi:hypothetical protein
MLLTGFLGFVDLARAVNVELEWEYSDTVITTEGVVMFFVYEATGSRCLDVTPLDVSVGMAEAPTKTFRRDLVPASSGPICFEVTAYNGLESFHSNRATEQAEIFYPDAPAGLAVEPLME